MESIRIDPGRCIGCGICASICIRDSIEVRDGKAVYNGNSCFSCYQCYAVCPKEAISIADRPGFEGESVPQKPMLSNDDLMRFLSERRSVRWFNSDKVSKEEFEQIFESARYSPTSMHRQDVEFAVIDDRLDDFMQIVYESLKPIEDTLPRIHDFCRYMEGTFESSKGHPFLWEGRQIILAFSEVAVDAVIAMTRAELAAYSMGLGGFYSLFMIMAAERDPERFSEFFSDIDPKKKLRCVFVIGNPRVKFRRTLPPRRLSVKYY
ncbi:MAG: nitroreductase family protein [archaeon]|nr:nitroreductase family protein [archaeon]